MVQALLVVMSVAMAGVAALTYRASFDEGVRSGNEVLISLPNALHRAFPKARSLSLAELEQWQIDPVLVDRVGLHPNSRQLVDSCGGKDQIWHEHAASGTLETLPDTFFNTPPYLHFSGLSYVYLAAGTQPEHFATLSFLAKHRAFLHVSELRELEPYGLPVNEPEARLAVLSDQDRHRLAEGVELLLGTHDVFVGIQSEPGPTRYRVYRRSELDSLLSSRGLAIALADVECIQTREGLCLASDPAMLEKKIARAQAFGAGSLALLLLAALGEAMRRGRERRRGERERMFMLQTLSHELRTPATSLALSVEPIRRNFDTLPGPVQPAFLRICDNVQRLQRMVDASSHYLRGEGGKLTRIAIPDVGTLLHDLSVSHDVSFECGFREKAGQLDIYWLGVCIRNLIENARHHGSPPIRLIAGSEGHTLLLIVEDGGIGLSMSLRSAVAAFSHRQDSSGMGLGLTIVNRIVRSMGGSLRYDTSPTRFTLVLPGSLS